MRRLLLVEAHRESKVGVVDGGVGEHEGHRDDGAEGIHLPDEDEDEGRHRDDEQREHGHLVRSSLTRTHGSVSQTETNTGTLLTPL